MRYDATSAVMKFGGVSFPVQNVTMGNRKTERIIVGREPVTVQTTGISVRAGVGGRRHRKRRRAEERRTTGKWFVYHPAAHAWETYTRTLEWANRRMAILILGRDLTTGH